MKTKLACFTSIIAGLMLASIHAQTTAFTFQGRLNDASGPATGVYDMTFTAWTAASGGTQVAGPITNTAVTVGNGLFNVSLNFGSSIFTGTNYWVEMGVRTNGGGSFFTLAPRQQLTPAPAAFTLSAQSPQFNSLCPVGTVVAFAGASAPPGWALCDGTAYSTNSSLSNLFAVILYTYGGSGASFNVPDLRGRAAIGSGTGTGLTARTLGQTLGEEMHTLITSEIPAHSHTVNDPGHSHWQRRLGGGAGTTETVSWRTEGGGIVNLGIATAGSTTGISIPTSGGGGAAHNVMQPSLVLNYIIKY